MESQDDARPNSKWLRCLAFVRFILGRMRAMASAWMVLGVAIGLNCEALLERNAIGVAANMLAWMIVMGLTGTIMSLFGGRPMDSWVGAALGALIALATGMQLMPGQASFHMQINFCALIGAIVAATCWPWVRVFAFVFGRVREMLASAS
jgi:hypothetical protein